MGGPAVTAPLPALGRPVVYRNGPNYPHNPGELSAAFITFVHDQIDGQCRVNLIVFHPNGTSDPRTDVSFGDGYNQWRWPDGGGS